MNKTIPPLSQTTVSSSVLLEYLENQKRIAIELGAPQGEIDLLEHIIKKVKDMKDKYYRSFFEC